MSNDKNIFKCGTHEFSTDTLDKWDKHCAELEHEYDVHTECANQCGERIHIKTTQKLAKEARRIPRGFVCESCKGKIQDAVIIPEKKEEGAKSE